MYKFNKLKQCFNGWFEDALELNKSNLAFKLISEAEGNEKWFPKNHKNAWCDILFKKKRFYAVFGKNKKRNFGKRIYYLDIHDIYQLIKVIS
jgi:hypothetical protein